jgi:hypothetical protein
VILDDIKLGPADRDGFCDVTAYRKDRMIDVVETIRLVPGVRVDWRTKSYRVPANCTIQPPPKVEVVTAPSGRVLRGYQALAEAEIERAVKGYMVCFDVGVGKTDPVCAYLEQHPELRPFIIVAPLIAMNSWIGPTSSGHHYNLTIAPLRSITPNDDKLPVAIGDRKVDGYFINFEILYVWGPWLHMKLDPKAVVVDEGHEMRNPRTVEAKAVRKLCRLKSVDMRLWLTATPVVNGVIDLYNQLDTVQPGMWGTMVPFNEKMVTSFGGRYASASYNGYGWDFGYESNVDELKHRLSSVLIRRTRAEVRSELPALQREKIEIDPDRLDPVAWARYREAAAPTGGSSDVIGRLSRMANELSWAKRKMAVSQAESLAHGVEGHKIVVFCWYQRTAGYIAKELAKRGFSVFGPITGKMPGVKRLAEAERFKDLPLPSDGCAAYVATLAAAGMSLNPLSAAAAALFTDLYWVPTQLIQAEGRVHREGQHAHQVLIQYLIVDDSMDTIMWEALQRKAKIIAKATDDKTALSLCESLGGRSEEETAAAFMRDLEALSDSALGLK